MTQATCVYGESMTQATCVYGDSMTQDAPALSLALTCPYSWSQGLCVVLLH